jgi:NADH-quinone oxidoreductase subunit I
VGYFHQVWSGIRTTAKGLAVTWRHFRDKPYTIQYPEEQPYFSPYERGLHEFETDKCIMCHLCAKACPVSCIYIHEEGRGKTARLTRFAIDYSKCLFCSLCIDPCPVDCIHMGQQFDLASFSRKGDGVILDFVKGEGPWRTAQTSDDGKAGLRAHGK